MFEYKGYWIKYLYGDKKVIILEMPDQVEMHNFNCNDRDIGETKAMAYINNLKKK